MSASARHAQRYAATPLYAMPATSPGQARCRQRRDVPRDAIMPASAMRHLPPSASLLCCPRARKERKQARYDSAQDAAAAEAASFHLRRFIRHACAARSANSR